MNNKVKLVAIISMLLVIGLTVVSFILSFNAIQQMAIETGVAVGWLSLLVPVVIDGAMIVFSLSALRNGLIGESARGDWVMISIATASSIFFNGYHAPREPVSIFVAVMPPFFLFTSFERLMAQIKSMVNRNQATVSLVDIKAQLGNATAKVAQLQGEETALQAVVNELSDKRQGLETKCQGLETKCQALETECEAIETKVSDKGKAIFTDTQLLGFFSVAPGATHQQAAKAMGVTRTAISTRMSSLKKAGVVNVNGKVEIL